MPQAKPKIYWKGKVASCDLYFFLIIISIFNLGFNNFLPAQQKNLPLNREFNFSFEKNTLRDTNIVHTNVRPVVESYYMVTPIISSEKKYSLFYRKLKKENLLIVKDSVSQFHLTIDPLFNFEYGKDVKDSSGEKLYKNTRGIIAKGDVGKKFSFESSFYENQSTFVKYIDAFNDTFKVIPGQGRWKKFKTNGYDYAMASGYISYSPNKHFNFQAGHGKNFVGDGYRSLLLSDNSFNYPYFRIVSSFGKIQYTNLYAVLINLSSSNVKTPPNTEPLFQKKAASFQVLSWNLHKRIQIGVFQGMIWQASDTLNKQHFNFYYYNPLIGISALKYELSNTNNVLLGAMFKLKVAQQTAIYGQYMLDGYSGKGSVNNKTGFQIGIKSFDVFKIKNLHFQAEYNQASPYAYAYKKPEQNYSHYNQPLAHPLGANFKEIVTFINYRLKDFFVELKWNYAMIGADDVGKNYGNNIFRSDNTAYYGINSVNNKQNQGLERKLMYEDFKIGYLINPSTNMNIIAGISNRIENLSAFKSNTQFLYVGLRTSLINVYYDF